VLVAVLCAAMTGITYAVVALSKESRVSDSGVMVVKGTDVPVATGAGLRGCCGGCCGTIWILVRSHGPGVMSPPITAGQVTRTSDLTKLHRMDPAKAAHLVTFSVVNDDNSTTLYRVGGRRVGRIALRARAARECPITQLHRRSFRSPR
jgi:hypothetical protein